MESSKMGPKVKFCSLCPCCGKDAPELPESLKDLAQSYNCPLLKDKICATCCKYDLWGGMGAPDTLEEVCQKTGKTPQEVHAACMACQYGGPKLETPMKLVLARDENGHAVREGPEFKAAQKREDDKFMERVKWLRGEN
jgi:hypothetical protein